MPIEVRDITEAQRDLILGLEESHFADIKAIEIAPSKLTKALSAFANADGGELYVGIDENNDVRAWRGFANAEAANAHIQTSEQLFPLSGAFGYTFLRCPGETGLVLQITVLKTGDIKVASDGKPYVRRGAQSLPVITPDAMRQLEYVKGLASFETETVNVEPDVITNSVPVIDFMLRIVPTAEPSNWLSKQRLMREGKPVVAGVLLFAEEPQALIPKRCGIKIYRYRTKAEAGTREALAFDPITIEGHIYAQIKDAVERTISLVEEARKLGDETLERISYPGEAVHEILTNAVLHRDYSVADDIHVRVFDNRIEIESPGRLPAHITVENILDERFARNGTLVRLINKFPDAPNKDVGEGLNTAFAAMTKLGLKPPVVIERPNSVLVIIRHEALASPEELTLEYLESHESIRNKTAREVCHVGADYIIKDMFKRLVARGLIERVPGTDRSTTAYRKGPNFASWREQVPKGSDSEG